MHLDVAALDHNIAVFHRWAAERGAQLAPHIKTTMCEPIVRRQLDAGAVGVTVATAAQAEQAYAWGIRDLWVINVIADREALARLRSLAEAGARVRTLSDSPDQLGILVDSLRGSPIGLLIDVGTPGGRTGVRTLAEADALLAQVAASGLELAGVSAYEGVVPNERDHENLARVRAHVALAVEVWRRASENRGTELAFTAGGSAFPDLAAEAGVPLVLRSGCYAVHDHGTYAAVSPVPDLRATCWVETTVTSVPEPGLSVLDAGKRELAYDAGLPVVLDRPGEITRLFDHHAIATALGAAVGETVRLGISHPCSLFDRWREVIAHEDGQTETWSTSF
ncbi:alanine racemase [Mariniluteicoccus endophyticus]